MLSIEIVAWALLLGGNYGIARSVAEPLLPDSQESHCAVQAWVRAEDLIPSSILNGDLRIKVDPSCAEDIVSVGLQLRLDEYAEVKFPKAGVVMPTAPVRRNVSEDGPHMWPFGMRDYLEGSDTEMGRYRTALRDPELWEVYAEERTAWKSAVTLHEGSIDYARPFVLPFAVATPHVQFPPGHDNSFRMFSNSSHDSPEPVAHAEHGYRYTALITFSDGRLEEVPAGYTTFHPVRRSAPVNQVLFTNVTFSRDGCRGDMDGLGACSPLWSRDDDAEVHTARIDLENGGVVHAGDILKGTLNFYTNTSGIRTVQIYTEASRNYKWGQSRAQDGGSDAFSPGSCFGASHISGELSTSSRQYGYVFGEEDLCMNMDGGYVRKPAAPSVEFQIQTTDDEAQNFQMHYADVQSFLEISIDFPYPSDIQKCLNPSGMVMQAPISETDLLEDRMWEAWRPLDDESISDNVRTYSLSARIPVTILGARKYALNSLVDPPVHYLDPEGVPSPVLLREAPPSIQGVVFPTAQPVISVKPKEDALKQMIASYRHFKGRESSLDYSAGEYAGVLWKKKYVAGIRTHHPVIEGSEGSEEAKSLKKVKSMLADNMEYIPRVQVPLAADPL